MPDKHDVRIILTGTKFISHFNIKNDTNKQHKHDLVYFSRCPSTGCTDSYIGETARRLSERVMDHTGRDTKSHIFRHSLNSNHGTVNIENFKKRFYPYEYMSDSEKFKDDLPSKE